MYYSVFEDQAGIIPMRDYCLNKKRDANVPLPTSYTKESIVNYLSQFYKFSILPTEDEVKEKLENIPHPTPVDLRNLLYAEGAIDILNNQELVKEYTEKGYKEMDKLLTSLFLLYYFKTIPTEKYKNFIDQCNRTVSQYREDQIENLTKKIEGQKYTKRELNKRYVLMTLNSYLSHDDFLGNNVTPDSEKDIANANNHTSTVKMNIQTLCNKKPGVYYNFICRYAYASDLAIIKNTSNQYDPKNIVNPEVYNMNFKYRTDKVGDMLLRRISEGKIHRVPYLKKAYDAKIAETLRNARKRRRLNAITSKIRNSEMNWFRRNQENKAGIWNKVNGKWFLRNHNDGTPPASSRRTRKRARNNV